MRSELVTATDHRTHCPFKGDASYWTIRVDGEERDNAVWSYPDRLPEAPPLAGYLAFQWDVVDEWWEEAERIGVEVRDPYHRCDVARSDRRDCHRVLPAGGRR